MLTRRHPPPPRAPTTYSFPGLQFSACLEASELLALNRELATAPSRRPTSSRLRHRDRDRGHSNCTPSNVLSSSSDHDDDDDDGSREEERWSVEVANRGPTLSEAVAGGAVGLEAFVGRKGRWVWL